MLIEHGIDHVNEGFVSGEEAMPAGEQVALEHAFDGVLAEHLHHPAIGGQFAAIGIFREVLGNPELLADLVDVLQLVGCVLVRAEDAEAVHVRFHDVSEESAQRPGILGFDLSGFLDLQAVVAEIRQAQRLLEESAVCVRIGAHAADARGASSLSSGISLPSASNSSSGF